MKVYIEQSFDAWGKRRNPTNWNNDVVGLSPTNYFHRGYTGHEHFDEFKIINMNGRLYDPVLGRMFSPDNYVQNSGFTQNFNRYSYAYNNPLKYTDPDGEFVVADSWLVGLVDGFFSSGSNRVENAWNEANHRAENDARIWGGLVQSDPNKSFGDRVWEVVSRFTWQLPQTVGGFLTAHSYNTIGLGGGVERVDYWGGATVIKTRGRWGGVAQGNYIVGDNTIEADPHNPLFQHEYGHYLQSQSMGWAYYPRVGIPSIRSQGDHGLHPVEQDANRRAFLYFNENVDGFQDDTELWNSDYRANKGWDFARNSFADGVGISTISNGLTVNYVNYQDVFHINTLDRIKVRVKWYDYASWLLDHLGR